MRCYFHVVGPSGAIPDDAGFDAPSLEIAEAEARQAIQEFWDEGMFTDEDWEGWQLEITDASQQVLLTIPFDQSQEGDGTERLGFYARKPATWLNSMLLVVVCGINWERPLAMF